MDRQIDISVVVPVSDRYEDVCNLYTEYKKSLQTTPYRYEFIFVLDGKHPEVFQQLKLLQYEGDPLKIVLLAKTFGFSTALDAGFENCSSDIVLVLPAFYQVQPTEIPKVLEALQTYDMVIGRRSQRIDPVINRLQSRIFRSITNYFIGESFYDLGCEVRAIRRHVIEELPIYGEQYRLLPVQARRRGFRVKEVNVQQSVKENFRRIYRPSIYMFRLLDILNMFFLVRFTKKPLRFFGTVGTVTLAIGGIFLIYLVFERLFLNIPLAERPALLISSLLIVLGMQIFALGLIGELIIFTHAKDLKEYTIDEIIN